MRTGPNSAQVGLDAVAVDSGVNVGVQVNQARGNNFAADLHDLGGFLRSYIGSYSGNLAIRHGHVV